MKGVADAGENNAMAGVIQVMGWMVSRIHGALRPEDQDDQLYPNPCGLAGRDERLAQSRAASGPIEAYQEVKNVRMQPWRIIGSAGGQTRRWLAALAVCSGLWSAGPAQAAWTVALKPDPLTRQPRCLARAELQSTPDGYDVTPVTLIFNGVSLLVVTESELDPSFADLQLVVDKNSPIRAARIARNMILVFDQYLLELVRQLRTGRQVVVYLRFWPTWPATESFAVPFSLAGFSKALDALNHNCQPPPGSGRPAS